MPLDPRAKRFLNFLAASGAMSMDTVTVEERRHQLAELMRFGGPAAVVGAAEERRLPGPAGWIAVRLYGDTRSDGELGPGLVYFHGGGLVAGSVQTHDSIARALAGAGRCRVVSVDYRLAPEHRFPAGFQDAVAAVDYVIEQAEEFGIDRDRLGVCGDSAGGSLAAAVCHARVDAGKPGLALQLLLCPILDYSRRTPSRYEFESGYLLDEATMSHDLLHCLPEGIDAADSRMSPLRGNNFAGLPSTILHTAECDPLRDEGRDYADQLSAAGSPVAHTCHPGMIHLFYGLASMIPYANRAWEQIGADLRERLAPHD